MNMKINKITKFLVPALAVSSLTPGFASAAFSSEDLADSLTFGGSLRLRYESKNDFNLKDSSQDYYLTQLRLNANWKLDDNHSFFIEMQDAQVYGEERNDFPSINDDATPNVFADDLDFHRAFYKYQGDGFSVKLGRQKFNLGDKRLVASLEWVNTARVHDGIRITLGENSKRKIDLFATALVPASPHKFNSQADSGNRYFDSEFHGAYVTDNALLDDATLHYWWFLRNNDDFDDEVHTFGLRYIKTIDEWTFDAQGGIQTGDFNDQDHEAYYTHMEVSRKFGISTVTVGYNYASGDDDPNDGDHETFDNLYPLNHAYYGYMDLLSLQNTHNVEFIYKQPVFNKFTFRAAWHSAWLAEEQDAWYNAGLAPNAPRLAVAREEGADKYVGSEIDFTLQGKVWEDRIKIWTGVSMFMPGDYAEDTGHDDEAYFAFLQATYMF